MLVDDDEITNFVHQSLLEEAGVTQRVLVASNGQEALELIKERVLQDGEGPCLIFLDINMPVMNGFEFLEAYQELEDEFKHSAIVVMLTTSLNPKDTDRVEEFGVNDFINKPLNKKKLLEVLEKHFNK